MDVKYPSTMPLKEKKMIDIDKVKKEFDKYVASYDPNQPRISLKVNHIRRVAENCKTIAEKLNLPEDEILLAEAIGYFHDIGRFEQVRIADTFSDRESGINHAAKSVSVLFDDDSIRNYIEDDQYDHIIKAAVLNHNIAKIGDGLDEKELLFAKIIRDADKLDIFYTISFDNFPAIFWYKNFDDEKISDIVMDEYRNHKLLEYKNVKSNADQIIIFYAYIYDFNFKDSLQMIANSDYLNKFTQRVLDNFSSPTIHEQMKEVSSIYKDYFRDALSNINY